MTPQERLKEKIERAKAEYNKFGDERTRLMNLMLSSKIRAPEPAKWQKEFDTNESRMIEARGYITGLETAYNTVFG